MCSTRNRSKPAHRWRRVARGRGSPNLVASPKSSRLFERHGRDDALVLGGARRRAPPGRSRARVGQAGGDEARQGVDEGAGVRCAQAGDGAGAAWRGHAPGCGMLSAGAADRRGVRLPAVSPNLTQRPPYPRSWPWLRLCSRPLRPRPRLRCAPAAKAAPPCAVRGRAIRRSPSRPSRAPAARAAPAMPLGRGRVGTSDCARAEGKDEPPAPPFQTPRTGRAPYALSRVPHLPSLPRLPSLCSWLMAVRALVTDSCACFLARISSSR